MVVLTAECDECGTEIKPKDGEKFYSLKTGDYCQECYDSMYENLIPPEEEDESG